MYSEDARLVAALLLLFISALAVARRLEVGVLVAVLHVRASVAVDDVDLALPSAFPHHSSHADLLVVALPVGKHAVFFCVTRKLLLRSPELLLICGAVPRLQQT